MGKLGFNVECVHDEGPWYNALEWVKAKHQHVTFGIRNTIEQTFRSLKHRLKRFHSFKHRSTKRTTLNRIKSYTTIPNIINTIIRR